MTLCDLLRDCPGGEARYTVWLAGTCDGNLECQGHPACERCAALIRTYTYPVAMRICTLPPAPIATAQ